MLTRFPLLFSLFIILPLLNANSISIPKTQCVFTVNQTNSTFVFQSCAYLSYYSDDWRVCFSNCCPGLNLADYSTPSLNALVICQSKYSESSSLSILLIGLITTAVVACLILVACIFIACVRMFKTAFRNRVFNQDQDRSIEWNCPELLTQDPLNTKWQLSNLDKNHIKENQCSICLEDGPNTQLFCGHTYHPYCIIRWLQKADFCPLCHRQNIRAVKLYCPSCKKYLLVRKKLLKTPQLLLKNGTCHSCVFSTIKTGSKDNSLIFQMSYVDISDGFIA